MEQGGKIMAVRRLREGKVAVGTMIRLIGNASVAILAANAGLDFIMVDLEHGPFGMETLEGILKLGRAIGIGCFVRVPELSKSYISRCLDLGATGIMVPMLESREEAQKFVELAKYAPLGKRGFGGIGAHTDFRSVSGDVTQAFMNEANESTLTIAQIETAKAIEGIDSIASVEGLDGLLIGPNDLSISIGCPGDLMGERVHQAVMQVAQAAQTHGKIFGMHAPESLLERWLDKGLRLIMSSLDTNIILSGFRSIAQRYKTH